MRDGMLVAKNLRQDTYRAFNRATAICENGAGTSDRPESSAISVSAGRKKKNHELNE